MASTASTSGSLAFVRFWLDTIAEWQAEHATQLFIALEVPKAQMDAILDDAVRGPMITAVDFHHWVYRPDGALFAIRGDLDRAPREQRPDIATPHELEALKATLGPAALDQRDFLTGPEFQSLFDTLWASSKPMRYRAWRRSRNRYPTLVILREDDYPDMTRAVERVVPRAVRERLRPVDLVRTPRETAWATAAPGDEYVVYSMSGEPVTLDLAADDGRYAVTWILGGTASGRRNATRVTGGGIVTLTPPSGSRRVTQPAVAWLSKVGS